MRRHVFTFPFILLACNAVASNSEKPAPETPGTSRVGTNSATAAPAGSSQNAQLTLVERPSEVCMVNDQFMGREQIPIEVDGKTYFGCCELCKGRLATDTVVRVAVDPVSGKQVDKATATIGALPNGKVLYFESEKNLNAYQLP